MAERKESKWALIKPPQKHAAPLVRAPRRQPIPASGRKKQGRLRKTLTSLPPMLDLVPQVHTVLRFQNSSLSAVNVSVASLLGACGTIGLVTNTSVRLLASAVKLHRITIWPANASGTPDFATLLWKPETGTNIGKEVVKDLTMPGGISVTGPLSFVPPRGTLWANWLEYSTEQMLVIACTTGAVVDVSVSWTQLCGTVAVQSTSVVTAVVGNPYYLPLDGVTTHIYSPVLLPSTF